MVMSLEPGKQIPCEHVPGKKKNCNSWAEFEPVGSSPTAKLCHGGAHDGEWFQPCPVRLECQGATLARAESRRSLPVMNNRSPFNEAKPFGNRPGSEVIARTVNLRDHIPGWGSMPTSLPQQKTGRGLTEPSQVPFPLPYPVQPPGEYPEAMRTPFVGPTQAVAGGITPTFLPQSGEGLASRLVKNIAQGAIGSTGWHIFDFARSVDFFGRKE